MAKADNFYFSHDFNARNDRKIAALVIEYKSAGYGIFMATIEMMHEEGHKLDFDDITFSAIAKDLNEEPAFIKKVLDACISKYKLFIVEDNMLISKRVQRNIEKRKEISSVRSASGKIGAKAKQDQANVEQTVANGKQEQSSVQQNQGKERKGKEIKESKEKKEYPRIISVSIPGVGLIEISVLEPPHEWQFMEIDKMVRQNQVQFQNIAIGKPILKTRQNFQKALQAFISNVQESDKYQTSGELSKYFSNWLNNKNGSLEIFLKSDQNKPPTTFL